MKIIYTRVCLISLNKIKIMYNIGMAEYISNYIAGFEDTVSRNILRELGGAEIIHVSGGFIHFTYSGKPEYVARLPFINNSFVVITKYGGGSGGGSGGSGGSGSGGSGGGGGAGLTFEKMVRDVIRKTFRQIGGNKSFRIRFTLENKFEKVPSRVIELAELAVIENCDIRVDRLKPDCEFWFIIRREGIGFFGQLLKKRSSGVQNVNGGKQEGNSSGANIRDGNSSDANMRDGSGGANMRDGNSGGANMRDSVGSAKPNAGQLRPELACLLCLDCELDKNTVVCDPFAGYGSIPLHIQQSRKFARMYVNDSDANLVGRLRKTSLGRAPGVVITCADAIAGLGHIADASVDYIITDPPWGFEGNYGDIKDFYHSALSGLKRIMKANGRMVLLTGRPDEMAAAAKRNAMRVISRNNILVNGKKASVFIIVSTDRGN